MKQPPRLSCSNRKELKEENRLVNGRFELRGASWVGLVRVVSVKPMIGMG